jgi:S-disulfanyl-L-cysteine oxidoreductase SoxD
MRLGKHIGVLFLLGLAATGAAQAGLPSSVWQGVYTSGQANRGKAHYQAHCAACHGVTSEGSDTAPGLNGGTFLANWDGLSAGDLFARIRTSMPANNPGSLSDEIVTDVMAYLFSVNQFPAGSTELPKDPGALKQIGITKAAH